MYYEVHGRDDGAPTVVLSSGLGGAAHYWAAQIPAFAAKFRVIAYDQYGTGRSGGTMADVTFNSIFVRDWADYAAINKVYAEYFPGDKPARYCIQCGLVKPDALVEIATIAHIGKK